LLHLIWRLLAWNPEDRILPAEALQHPFFGRVDTTTGLLGAASANVALESQMLDPSVDFNASDSVNTFICPKCKREFKDWQSCYNHANARKHGRFCKYDTSKLPSCLNTHAMLPAHASSGYCDIQGRRRTIEDFHSIHLETTKQFYSIFDGHFGNLAAKFSASLLYEELTARITEESGPQSGPDWKGRVTENAVAAFASLHDRFMKAIKRAPFMDQSGTTATALLVMESFYVIVSLGDTRAVIATRNISNRTIVPLQLTIDHTAANTDERRLVEARGGFVRFRNNVYRVNGVLTITRSVGDENLAHILSREPHVLVFTRDEMKDLCGVAVPETNGGDSTAAVPCFIVLASDGLWDVLSNSDTVALVSEVVESAESSGQSTERDTTAFQQASEALVHEAYVRGTTDNVGVCLVAIE
jgi:serine/threonine protein phosphatase PrpC